MQEEKQRCRGSVCEIVLSVYDALAHRTAKTICQPPTIKNVNGLVSLDDELLRRERRNFNEARLACAPLPEGELFGLSMEFALKI